MKAQCVVCGAEFEKRGAAKTCNVNCGRVNKAENNRRYRAANLAKFREKDRRYYAANPEKVREKKRRCYAANPEKVRENNRRYRAANLAKLREKDRRCYAANPEKVREKKRRCYAANSAARSLGLPPILYASLKIKEKLYENGNRP